MAALRRLAQIASALAALSLGATGLTPARAAAGPPAASVVSAPRTLEARVSGLRARLDATSGRLAELKALADRAGGERAAPPASSGGSDGAGDAARPSGREPEPPRPPAGQGG